MLGLSRFPLGIRRLGASPSYFDQFGTPETGFSFRSLDGTDGNVIEARRSIDDDTRAWKPSEILNGSFADWANNAGTDATLPADFGSGAGGGYGLRYVTDDYSGDAVEVRRSSDDNTSEFTPPQILDGSLTAWVNESFATWESDFSSGTDGVGADDVVLSTGTYFGEDDVLKVELSNGLNVHQAIKSLILTTGQYYNVSFNYYIPSTNTAAQRIVVNGFNGGPFAGEETDAWTTKTINNVDANTTGTQFRIQDSGGNNFIDGDGECIYLKNILFTQITADGAVRTLWDQKETTAKSYDFSAGSDGLSTVGGSSAAPTTFEGVDDALKFTINSSSGTHFPYEFNVFTGTGGAIIEFDYYIPSSNTIVDGIQINDGSVDIGSAQTVTDAWTTVKVYGERSGTSLYVYTVDGSNKSYVGNGTDVIYIKNVVAKNSNSAQQTTATAQPLIVEAGVLVTENGLPAIKFDGVDDYLDTTVDIADDYFVSSVFSWNSGASFPIVLGAADSAPNRILIVNSTNSNAYQFLDGTLVVDGASGSVPANTQTMVCITKIDTGGAAANLISTNGVQKTSSTSFTNLSSQNIRIGYEGSGSFYFDGKIQEIVLNDYSVKSDIEAIEANTNAYYSIYTKTTQAFVRTWYNQGTGADAIQTTAANQPLIIDAGVLYTNYGLPAIKGDGVNDSLPVTLSTRVNSIESIITLLSDSGTSGNSAFDLRGGSFWRDSSTRFRYLNGGNQYATTAAITGSDGAILFVSLKAADYDLWQNGVQATESGSISPTYTTTLNILAAPTVGVYHSAGISEFVFYLDDKQSDRAEIEANINEHYTIY